MLRQWVGEVKADLTLRSYSWTGLLIVRHESTFDFDVVQVAALVLRLLCQHFVGFAFVRISIFSHIFMDVPTLAERNRGHYTVGRISEPPAPREPAMVLLFPRGAGIQLLPPIGHEAELL